MSAEVRLTISRGFSAGKIFAFRERASVSVGRSDDCSLRLPSCLGAMDVSRHHCLLDIDPPSIRVRDLGSRNGTFVNEVKIGQRDRGVPAEAATATGSQERPLAAGDELRVGSTVFCVSVSCDDATLAEAAEVVSVG
jgi:serine/threonine-protein kinase